MRRLRSEFLGQPRPVLSSHEAEGNNALFSRLIRRTFQTESQTLKKFECLNILQLYGICFDKSGEDSNINYLSMSLFYPPFWSRLSQLYSGIPSLLLFFLQICPGLLSQPLPLLPSFCSSLFWYPVCSHPLPLLLPKCLVLVPIRPLSSSNSGPETRYSLVMELCDKGTLRELLQTELDLDWDRRVLLALDTAKALYRWDLFISSHNWRLWITWQSWYSLEMVSLLVTIDQIY